MSSKLDRITDWGAKAARANYRLDALAEQSGVSERHLRRHLTATLGLSPREWLVECRMRAALIHLHRGLSVKETAHLCQFPHVETFCRQFKNYYKTSPGKYAVLSRHAMSDSVK